MRSEQRQREREVSLELLMEENEEFRLALLSQDQYFGEQICIDNFDIEINDETLLEAFKLLTETQKEIILYYYFLGMCDREIGELLTIPASTARYKRREAQTALGKILESRWGK